jgi:hypothetical protein
MLIYSQHNNERFRFAASMVLHRCAGAFEFTSDLGYFEASDRPKIYYGDITGDVEFPMSIQETSWMWEDKIYAKLPKVKADGEMTRIYFDDSNNFDVFAAVFWMLSRYEEYIALKHDRHGRFISVSSVLGWDNDTRMPWADIWRKEFVDRLIDVYPNLTLQPLEFSLRMTVDVDSAFAYRHKGFVRTAGAMGKDILRADFANLMRRITTVLFAKHDPYDTYQKISTGCDQSKMNLTWFFLLANRSKEDIGVSYQNKNLRAVITNLSQRYRCGIHPGYGSHEDDAVLRQEIRRLEEITKFPVLISRQHYLKMSLPETYRRLIDNGVMEDHTMGFAANTGFRAGTNYAFPWFDLKENKRTNLMIHPFVIMDTTLRDYLGLTPEEAIVHIEEMISQVKPFGGEFTFLWHNESVSEMGKWRGWSKVFDAILAQQEG